MPTTPTLTPLAVAALALLAEGPTHPYEMYQTLVQRSEDRLVKVRPGFARNYLLPQKKALRATKANMVYFEQQKVQLEAANLQRLSLFYLR